jgi:serine/threonine protein phosphatase PrpC
MKDLYETYGYTISNVGKEKNGDSYIYEIIEENVLIAVVADGVSKQPCDWFASELTCTKLVEYFKRNAEKQDIKIRLRESILQVNEYVINIEGNCHRMASTLSVIVWQTQKEYLTYVNIGDSRIYSSFEGKLELLTQDDAIIIKERVLMHGGLRVINKSILNKVIGQPNITFKVAVKDFKEDEIIILATDGFYDSRKAIFNQTMAELSLNKNLDEGFQNVIKKFEILRGDDFTTVMIRRKKQL